MNYCKVILLAVPALYGMEQLEQKPYFQKDLSRLYFYVNKDWYPYWKEGEKVRLGWDDIFSKEIKILVEQKLFPVKGIPQPTDTETWQNKKKYIEGQMESDLSTCFSSRLTMEALTWSCAMIKKNVKNNEMGRESGWYLCLGIFVPQDGYNSIEKAELVSLIGTKNNYLHVMPILRRVKYKGEKYSPDKNEVSMVDTEEIVLHYQDKVQK